MRARMGILVMFATVIGLAGCTTPDAKAPPSSTPTTRSTADRPAVPRPKDRDENAVAAALRQLDLCGLLDKANAASRAITTNTRPRRNNPFLCELTGSRSVVTTNAAPFDHQRRISSSTRTIGGAKAYVRPDSRCTISLPVSFTTALQFAQLPSNDDCGELTKLVGAAVKVLANPDSVRTTPAWTACAALAGALDEEPDKAKLVGYGPDTCMNPVDKADSVSIAIAQELPPPSTKPRTTTIGRTRVSVYKLDDTCEAFWRQRSFDSRYAAKPDYQVQAVAVDCDQATALAESLMGVLAKPPTIDTAPQRPLLYRPDEPDNPYPGACASVDEIDPRRCEPYVEAPVPGKPAEIVRAAADDADVQCAMSAKAIGARFGAELTPVADSDNGTRCFFVEPQRQLQLTFSVAPGMVTNDLDGKSVTIAARPGYVSTDTKSFQYELSTTSELLGEAAVTLAVSGGPATEKGPPADADAKARSVLADIVRAYFS